MEDGMEVVTSLNREKLGEIIRSSVRTEELMRMRGGGGAEAPSEGDQLSQCNVHSEYDWDG